MFWVPSGARPGLAKPSFRRAGARQRSGVRVHRAALPGGEAWAGGPGLRSGDASLSPLNPRRELIALDHCEVARRELVVPSLVAEDIGENIDLPGAVRG